MAVDPISNNPSLMPFVCVVEPNAAVARRISDLIDPAGVAVRRYADGRSLLADTPEDAVCIISEMTLPDMTGADLISALRGRGNHTPVILLAEESDVTASRGYGPARSTLSTRHRWSACCWCTCGG
jgi:FixJ family two-component response regulator